MASRCRCSSLLRYYFLLSNCCFQFTLLEYSLLSKLIVYSMRVSTLDWWLVFEPLFTVIGFPFLWLRYEYKLIS
jgi:hypothetical protein